MTTSVNNLAALAPPRQSPGEPARPTGVGTLTQADFLRLLTTQLTHQDPTEPLDNEQFVAQMAQFSTVSGIEKLNEGLGTLGDKLDGNRIAAATSLIGKSVLVPGDVAARDADGGVSGAVDLAAPAENLVVTIADAAGQPIRELALGPQSAGRVGFAWDGRDASGQPVAGELFRVTAQALRGGESAAAATSVFGRVRSVGIAGDGAAPSLDVTGVGAVAVGDVRQIRGE